jgi:uncharacterized protein
MRDDQIQRTFGEALEALIEQVKQDRSVLAAILCGSLSHDLVWAKSDIDLVLITIDDKQAETTSLALDASGVNVHAMLFPRGAFRKLCEGATRNSFMHSFVAKGRLLYTHDPALADLHAGLAAIGERDTEVQLLRAATHALPAIYKAHKWMLTRKDLDYTALWILYAATPLAQIEVFSRRVLADREVIPQARTMNPAFFDTVYVEMLNAKKTAKTVQAALDAIDRYIAERAPRLFRLIVDYLDEAGEARSSTEIETHFERHHEISHVLTGCEYLADQGLIGKAATPVRLTRKSNVMVQELAFFPLRRGPRR